MSNVIVMSSITNNTDGSIYIYMYICSDNGYLCLQLLVVMLTNYNLHGVGTCKANRKGFASNKLPMDKQADRGNFIRLVDK